MLISTKPGSKQWAEKDAEDNKDLAVEAFDSIKKAKLLLETKCPGVVSCADILAIAARDFVHLVCMFIFSYLTPTYQIFYEISTRLIKMRMR